MTNRAERNKPGFKNISTIGLYMGYHLSLSLSLKTKVLFGKTNKVKFHEEFLTIYIYIYENLGVGVPNSQILFVDLNKNSLKFWSNVFSIKVLDTTKLNTTIESLTLPDQILMELLLYHHELI